MPNYRIVFKEYRSRIGGGQDIEADNWALQQDWIHFYRDGTTVYTAQQYEVLSIELLELKEEPDGKHEASAPDDLGL